MTLAATGRREPRAVSLTRSDVEAKWDEDAPAMPLSAQGTPWGAAGPWPAPRGAARSGSGRGLRARPLVFKGRPRSGYGATFELLPFKSNSFRTLP